MVPDEISQDSDFLLIFFKLVLKYLLLGHSLFISLLLAVYDNRNYFSDFLNVIIGSYMIIPWTLTRAFWTAVTTIEVCTGRRGRISWPLTNLATGDLTNVAHLNCLAKIGVWEGCSGLVLGVFTVLFNLLFIALPVDQVHLSNVKLLRSINNGGLGGLDGLFKVLARL